MAIQPVIFGGSFTNVAPGGASGPDNPNAFINQTGFPIWVDEFRFYWSDIPTPGGAVIPTLEGDVVRVSIEYGREPITANFVPLNLLCRAINPEETAPFTVGSAPNFRNSMAWKFPQPMYVEAGRKFDIQAQNLNDFAAAANTAGVVFDTTQQNLTLRAFVVGRYAEPGDEPDTIDIPYASKFLGAVFGSNPGTTSGAEPPITTQSGPNDLFNPFNVPLLIERFVYEISTTAADATAALIPCDGTTIQAGVGSTGLDRRYVQIRVTSHDNKAIVRDYTPIGAVFSATDRSWQVNTILIPRGYYFVDLLEEFPILSSI